MAKAGAGAAIVTGAPGTGPFSALLGRLDPRRPVLVQTHDYPDIDAVASAWALAALLSLRGLSASAVHHGEIRSRSLSRLVEVLGIGISSSPSLGEAAQILVVDGSPTNGNVRPFPGELVGVVDHHRVPSELSSLGELRSPGKQAAPFADLRPELASCSSMIYGYWKEAGAEPPRELATALLAGIQSDTDFLSRRSSPEDFRAYTELFRLGDWELASRIVRTVFDLRELGLIARALAGAEVEEGILYAEVEGPCGQEALAVLADFALRAEELRATVVAERDEAGTHVSARSRSAGFSAFDLVREALEGLGSGGGHSHASGGLIPAAASPDRGELRRRFFAVAARRADSAPPQVGR